MNTKLIARAKLLKKRQVAKLFQISERTVLRLTKAGILPTPVRVGRSVRWREEELIDCVGKLAEH